MGGPVPQEWTDMHAALMKAAVAGPIMRDAKASDMVRDRATQEYVAASDIVIAKLLTLRERQELGRITAFLSKRERT